MEPISAIAVIILLFLGEGKPANVPFCETNPLHVDCNQHEGEGGENHHQEETTPTETPSAPYSPGDFPNDPWGDNLDGNNPDFYCGACEEQGGYE